MATNNFKPFSIGTGANVISQADYEALTALLTGFQSGKASSAQINKALRQGTVMAYVLAQFISDSASVDVLDNGNPATILANMKAAMTALTPGRLINVQSFTANATYTPTPGTKKIRVQIVGGGGGGGGAQATSSGQASCAGGGCGGAYAEAYMPVPATPVALTVGAAGSGGSRTGPTAGSAGGSSVFGSYITCPGGTGGGVGNAATYGSPFYRGMTLQTPPTISLPTGAVLISSMRGQSASGSVLVGSAPNQGVGGIGGSSPFGVGGNGGGGVVNGTPTAANGYGAGGGGGVEFSAYGGDEGGAGTGGLCIIWEYA